MIANDFTKVMCPFGVIIMSDKDYPDETSTKEEKKREKMDILIYYQEFSNQKVETICYFLF